MQLNNQNETILEIKGLHLSLDGCDMLRDVNLTFESGKIYTLLGRTLAGKTTLLKLLTGLLEPTHGEIMLAGADFTKIPVWKRNIAMVYQQFINYPHLTVRENIEFPLRNRKDLTTSDIQSRVQNVIGTVGLEGLDERKIQELSGGQQQRVALARSLVKQSNILLLDEPLVNLDYKLREQLREEFKLIFDRQAFKNSILIYTTTDPLEAMELSDKIVILHEGQVLQTDSPKAVFEKPSNTKVAEIISDPGMNFVSAEKRGECLLFGEAQVKTPVHFESLDDGEYLIGVRPFDIKSGSSGIKTTIELSEISGSETFTHFTFSGQSMVMASEGVQNRKIGDEIYIEFDSSAFFAFFRSGGLALSPFAGSG